MVDLLGKPHPALGLAEFAQGLTGQQGFPVEPVGAVVPALAGWGAEATPMLAAFGLGLVLLAEAVAGRGLEVRAAGVPTRRQGQPGQGYVTTRVTSVSSRRRPSSRMPTIS